LLKQWLGRLPPGPESLLEGLWLATALTVPLALSPWGANAFELPKALLLRLLVLLMALAALLPVLENRRQATTTLSPQRSGPKIPLLWPGLLLGLALVLATVFSVAPQTSLWGSYDRQQGLLTLAAYLALFFLVVAHLRSRAQVMRLWLVLVWGSAPLVVYGLLQAAGLDPLAWQTDAASAVLSTLGRANFVGSYLVLVAPLTATRLVVSGRRWPYALLLAGQVACLALTQARAAWLGMAAALLVGLLAWTVTGQRRKRQRAAPVLAILTLAALAVGFVALLNLPGGPLAPLTRLPGLDRLATLAGAGSGSGAARLVTWRATLPLIAERAVLGYGPETMRPVFARVFPPELVYYQGRHVSVDRAHNLWLDLGMSAGLAGILALGALLAGWGWLAWRGRPDGGDRWGRAAGAGLLAAVAGHLVDLQFSFDLTASATVFWLVLAMGAALWARHPLPARREARTAQRRMPLQAVPPALLVLILAWLACARPLLADVAYQQARDAPPASGERLTASSRAVRLWPLEPAYRLELAWALLEHGQATAAVSQLAAAEQLSSDHPGLWAAIGGLYAAWGEVSPEELPRAEAAYRRALELSPNVATYHTALGLILVRQGRPEEGLAELDRAVALDATDSVAYRHLADLYERLGREEQAAWARQQAERWERETMTP
jgi:O-antigen ligase/Flp pilus assembly protein TadD